jgi:ribosomal protein S3AE
MVKAIELPADKIEADFILALLRKLNVRILENVEVFEMDDDVLTEHTAILTERRAKQATEKFYSWDEAQEILANRKKNVTLQ